ncbi:hypothetical protein JKP88DRAFT_339502 [Tribonema minus]|uniref:Uncharacterized protein n=1 Tax=Tribonema minus TaxID=303371 RepID=A0A836C716_9STRA|nr:hypothetical protein JKP88DRAFT_339502 [Tribonema minus]
MAAPPMPSAVMVKLYGIEEQVLPTTVKLHLLNAISLLQGAEQRKARGLAGRLEEPARLLAALSLASSQYASNSATGDETEALQSLLDCGMRSFFARLSLAGSRGSNGAFAPMHGMFASTTSNKLDVDGVLAEDAKHGRAVMEQGDGSSSSRNMCGFDGVHERIAELVALGLVAGDKEEKAHALLPNGARLDSDDMDALQSALSCTLGVVLARMMSEERKTRYSNAVTAHGARPATTPATQGIGAMVEKLLTVVSSSGDGARSLFPDLDAREGCFAASKYRDILVARKAELTALMEMMSQVQGLKRTIVDAQPAPMSPLPPPKRAALRSAAHLALKCNAALSSRGDSARSDRARGGVAEFRKALSVATEATECSDGDEQASPSLETNEFTGNRVLVI